MGSKRAFVFVNGVLSDPPAIRALIQPGDMLVAADGGLQHLQTVGLKPDLIIGDLDSVDPQALAEMQAQGVRVERYPREKDETDLELALLELSKQGFNEVRIVAALGGRLDQTLANLYLLELDALENVDARIDDGHEEILIIRERAVVEGQPGDTLSLLAMDGCTKGILTQGLKYPLDNGTLCPTRSRGVSNVMLGERAEVRVRSGRLLCIHTRQPQPVAQEADH
jgi:thiamine pyrophosphokinase